MMDKSRFKSKSALPTDKFKRGSKEIIELQNQLARALADYDNLRKRVEEKHELWIKYSAERVVKKLIPVLDTLESAQNHLKDQGLAIAILEFKKVLTEDGIEEIKPKIGDNFDAHLHEAVESISGGKKGQIADLILPGWKFKDGKVIRYAKVKVFGERLEHKKEELDKEMARGDYA